VAFCVRDREQGLELGEMGVDDVLGEVLLDVKAGLLLLLRELLYAAQL